MKFIVTEMKSLLTNQETDLRLAKQQRFWHRKKHEKVLFTPSLLLISHRIATKLMSKKMLLLLLLLLE